MRIFQYGILAVLASACLDKGNEATTPPVPAGVRADIYYDIIDKLPNEDAKKGAVHVARGMFIMTASPENEEAVLDAAKMQTQGIECLGHALPGGVADLVSRLETAHMDTPINGASMLLAQGHLIGMLAPSWSDEEAEAGCVEELL